MNQQNNYYISNKKKHLNKLNKIVLRIHPQLEKKYGLETSKQIHQQILSEFETLLPKIPYIGGKKNKLSIFLLQSAWALSFYRVIQFHGGTVDDAGELLQCAAEAMFNAVPVFIRHLYGTLLTSKWQHKKMAQAALETQKKQYSQNWVMEFIPGDGQSFDFGYDYTECGIVKFLKAQDATELIPYLCETDFAALRAMGLKLERTETIASGCQRCNFRISKIK